MNAAFGRYRLLERLGQGGMAEVFKAKSYGVEGFEKVLVIKRILPELAKSQDFVDMFIHEAKLAVRLSHANIVQVFDLGKAPAEQGDAYFMAMEFVQGLDLSTLLARARRQQLALPIPMGAYIASEVAKGLDHAHRRRDEQMRPLGIVHRDVSPQNVLLSFEGEVKVTDFGIAKARGALGAGPDDTNAKRLQGKFGYMSPEQSRGENVDSRSDLFSLGTMLWECVAGVNPFSAPTTFETLRRVQACECPPIELLRPDVPPDLVEILKTAMAKNPADRFPDAGRMYEALLAFLYAQGSRYGAHDLAELLARFREGKDSMGSIGPAPLLETEASLPATERTPVEIPASRQPPSMQMLVATPSGALERTADMGERREVTGLVIELAREASPVIAARAASIIGRWGGHIMRQEEGQLAAVFGADEPDGRDTEMATRCALVALRSIDASGRPSAGVHIGRIHVASSGEPTKDHRLAALLDTARDLARAREGGVAMSAQAMRQVKALFEFEAMGEGDNTPGAVSGVLVKDVRGPSEAFGRFVGRKDELRRVGEVLAGATKRNARVLTIRGDHGIGKTRLLYEVERRLRKGGYNVGFHVAVCPPRGDEFPLSGVVCMLQILCGTFEGDSQERITAVQPRLRALGLQTDEVSAVLTALGANVPSFSGNAKVLLRQAFTRMVQSLCEDRPHSFAWDAAHAMDEESIALLGDVLQRLRQARVVFAFAARAGYSHPLERFGGHVAIDLGDLTAPDVERLAGLRLGVDTVPDELLRFVRARAGGHPLFVEEVLKGLVDVGAVAVAERRVVSMRLVGQELALPKTLRGLVASRVARLSPRDRAALQAAAVLGDPIDVTVLSTMLGLPVPSLERSIAMLKEREFLVQTGPSELRFASPLIPEIVVDALTPEAAREMHAAAGQALESALGERASEHSARIAGHLYEAGDRERAAAFYAKSGERRLETKQLEAAARDYARAITLAEPSKRTPEELVGWLESLTAAVRLVRASPDALELCNRVVERADQASIASGADGRVVRVRARVAAGQLLAAAQHMEEARQRLSDAEIIAGGDASLVKSVLLAEAELAARRGDFKPALDLLRRVQQIVKASSDVLERHRVAVQLAISHGGIGDRRSALAHLQEAEQLLPNDRTAQLERAKNRALVDYFTAEFRSAALYCERAIEMSREMGFTYEVMLNLHNLGDSLVHLDDLPRAYGAFRQSLALCEESGYERLANYNRMFLAFLDGVQGTVDGDKLLRQGIAYAESRDFVWDVIGGRALLAKLLRRGGHAEAARVEFERTRALAAAAGQRLVVDECDAALRAMETAPTSSGPTSEDPTR